MYICIVLVLLKMFVDGQFHIFCCGVKRSLASTSMSHFCLKKTEVLGDNSAHVGHLRNGVHSSLSRVLTSLVLPGCEGSTHAQRVRGKIEMQKCCKQSFKMSRLYIAKAPSFSSLEAFVVCLSISREGKGAFLQMLKAKCRSVI